MYEKNTLPYPLPPCFLFFLTEGKREGGPTSGLTDSPATKLLRRDNRQWKKQKKPHCERWRQKRRLRKRWFFCNFFFWEMGCCLLSFFLSSDNSIWSNKILFSFPFSPFPFFAQDPSFLTSKWRHNSSSSSSSNSNSSFCKVHFFCSSSSFFCAHFQPLLQISHFWVTGTKK